MVERKIFVCKFVVCEAPTEITEAWCSARSLVVMGELQDGDDLRVLALNNERGFGLFRLEEVGGPIMFDDDGSG